MFQNPRPVEVIFNKNNYGKTYTRRGWCLGFFNDKICDLETAKGIEILWEPTMILELEDGVLSKVSMADQGHKIRFLDRQKPNAPLP